jgi:adenylate cyclase
MSTPPDIFLSYNREDQIAARRFAEAFEEQGFKVWWDATLRSGEAYDEVTEKALRDAKAVVVLWSKKSVVSRWVRAEATLANRNKTLVPVMIEPCDRPIMFELTQTAELFHWQGDAADKTWLAFSGDVRRFVEAHAAPTGSVPAAQPPAPSQAPAVSRPNKVSIVVLPFANMSGDAEQEYFSDGISEDIITDLSKVAALSVISRNSAFTFKGKHVDLPQVARQLQVTHVLEGSVRKSGNRVRITAQLIDGATNDHVWAERYDRDLSDIFALQDELSQAIVAALKLKLFPEEKKAIEDRGTSDIEDFDKYLRARALFNTLQPKDLDRAAVVYRELIARDPSFTRARSGLAEVYHYQLIYSPERNATTAQALEEAVASALAHARDDWSTQFASAILFLQRREWAEAERAYALAAERASVPYAGLSEFRAWMLLSEGRMKEGVALLQATAAIDPLSVGRSFLLQTALFSSGQAEAAEAEYQRSLELPGQREAIEHFALMRIWDDGDARLVRSRFDRFLSHAVVPMPTLEAIRDVHDDPAAALALLHVAAADPANSDATRQTLVGHYASHFGDIELALASLRRATLHGSGGVTVYTLWWPGIAAVRREPGFKRLVSDLGLVDYWRASGNWGDFARPLGADDFECF